MLAFTQIVVFTMGKEEYGIDISHVQEIIRIPQITKMPNMPVFIVGVINLRGKVIPVIDLKKRFEIGESDRNNDCRLLISELDGMKLGIIVDDVQEVLRVDEQKTENLGSEVASLGKNSVDGIAKIDQRLIILLNALKLKHEILQSNEKKEMNL